MCSVHRRDIKIHAGDVMSISGMFSEGYHDLRGGYHEYIGGL